MVKCVVTHFVLRILTSVMHVGFSASSLSAIAPKASSYILCISQVSDGGVHAHIDHLFRMLEYAKAAEVPNAYIHFFSDGRDTGTCALSSERSSCVLKPVLMCCGICEQLRIRASATCSRCWTSPSSCRMVRLPP